jgi:hypothetical protein
MPLLVEGGLLRGHDRRSMSLTVALGIGTFENSKNEKIITNTVVFGMHVLSD